MAEKDILEKALMSHADVFADCVNALAYQGRYRLAEADLQPAPTESFYQGKEKVRNQFCDKSFYRMADGVVKAQYIIGNETKTRRWQVVRKASYQGGAYRDQLGSAKPMYPVIGMVLDWTRKTSRIPLSLWELLEEEGALREELELADDVRLAVFYMRNLPREVRERFVSDMGFVVDYLNTGGFDGRGSQRIIHVKELCEMMEALTGDSRFTEKIDGLLRRRERGEEVCMCEYIDMLEARGERRGIIIGEKRGKKKGEKKGEKRLADLIQLLLKEKKYDEIKAASNNDKKRKELYHRYGIH